MIPLIATTLVYMIIIKIITGILGHFIKGRDVVAEDFDDIDELDGIDEPGEELKK